MRDTVRQKLERKGLKPETIEKLGHAIDDLMPDLVPLVERIESAPMTTRNHYGSYLACFSGIIDRTQATIMALALENAGANPEGVRDAFNVCYR